MIRPILPRAFRIASWLLPLACVWVAGAAYSQGTYLEPQRFLEEVFGGDVPHPKRLWITAAVKPQIKSILDHDLRTLRVRYWRRGDQTVWILEEIGKERPITTGLVVQNGVLTDIRVLVFRESRGWDVRYPYFTEQFHGATLGNDYGLDRHIDGISGATLSVTALKKLARLALLLHQHATA